MASAPLRFAVEALALVALGVALVVADLDLTVFAIVMAVGWVVVATLERTVLQPNAAPFRRAAPSDDEPLPLHEAERGRPAPSEAAPDVAPAPAAETSDELEPVEAAAGEPESQPDEQDPSGSEAEEAPVAEAVDAQVAAPVELPPAPVGEVAAEPAPEEEHEPAAELEREPDVQPETEPQREPEAGEAAPRPLLVEAPPAREPPPPEEPPSRPAVVDLPLRGARGWNLWDLERRARERAGIDPAREEEWAALFVHLREYASPDGMLPPEFDELVRESFAELLAAGRG